MDLRFSFSSFGITRIDGRVLLLLNKNRLHKGEAVLTLPGGVYDIHPASESYFTELGARFIRKTPPSQKKSRTPKTDLRFFAPKENIEALCAVYERYFAGEPSSLGREYYEELYKETHLLRWWHMRVFPYVALSHVAREQSVTTRAGEEGNDTVRMMSFFDINLTPAATAHLARTARWRPRHQQVIARLRKQYVGAYAYLATEDEIRAGRTENGAEIAAITQLMFPSA